MRGEGGEVGPGGGDGERGGWAGRMREGGGGAENLCLRTDYCSEINGQW